MSRGHPVWIAVQNLVLKGGVLAGAVSLCVLMMSRPESGEPVSQPVAATTFDPGLVSDTAQVAMSVPAGRLSSRYSMRDEAGREVVLVTYNRDGVVDVLLGEAFPTRAACLATPEGMFKLGVTRSDVKYSLEIKRDGSSDYSVLGTSLKDYGRLSLSPDGQPIPDAVNVD